MSLPRWRNALTCATLFFVGCTNVQNWPNNQIIASRLVGYWYRSSSLGMSHGPPRLTEIHILMHRRPDGSFSAVNRSFDDGVLAREIHYVGRWQLVGDVYLERREATDECKLKGTEEEQLALRSTYCRTYDYRSQIKELSSTEVIFAARGPMSQQRVDATFELPKEARLKRSNSTVERDARKPDARSSP